MISCFHRYKPRTWIMVIFNCHCNVTAQFASFAHANQKHNYRDARQQTELIPHRLATAAHLKPHSDPPEKRFVESPVWRTSQFSSRAPMLSIKKKSFFYLAFILPRSPIEIQNLFSKVDLTAISNWTAKPISSPHYAILKIKKSICYSKYPPS